MSFHRPSGSRSIRALVALLVVSAAIAGVAGAGSAGAAPERGSAKSVCSITVSGAAWTFKGQHGTKYTIIGVSGGPCSLFAKFVPRLTHAKISFDLKPVPAGWHCSSIGVSGLSKLGQCTSKASSGIVEWVPMLQKTG
jgi:hypothetical protein